MPLPYQISSPMDTNVQCVESIEDIYMSSCVLQIIFPLSKA